MFEQDEDYQQASYWPSATDLFMTLFIIAIAILAVVFFSLLPKNNTAAQKQLIVAVGVDMGNIRKPVNDLRKPLELVPIAVTTAPDQVVAALKDTSQAGILKLQELQNEIASLSRQLDDLSGDKNLLTMLSESRKANESLKEEVERLRRMLGRVDGQSVAELLEQVSDLEKQLHDKPPIIRIDEQREEYRFKSGSSEIGFSFAEGLRDSEFARLANEIVGRQEEGRVKVDTLEIIGHTDGVPLSGRGNLDQMLPSLLAGSEKALRSLTSGSNNDLGLLRALSVRHEWKQFVAGHPHRGILDAVSVRCYSAGQTILPAPEEGTDESTFRRSDPRARRIEMRLTRLRDS